MRRDTFETSLAKHLGQAGGHWFAAELIADALGGLLDDNDECPESADVVALRNSVESLHEDLRATGHQLLSALHRADGAERTARGLESSTKEHEAIKATLTKSLAIAIDDKRKAILERNNAQSSLAAISAENSGLKLRIDELEKLAKPEIAARVGGALATKAASAARDVLNAWSSGAIRAEYASGDAAMRNLASALNQLADS